MKTTTIISILFLFLVSSSCVDKFWPKVDKYENALVVDGLLTNGNDPSVVKLSYSSSINNADLIPVSGGAVYLATEIQGDIFYSETEPGIYTVLDSSFRGISGNSYQLNIKLPNGSIYRSEVSRLLESSPIDSLYGLEESHETTVGNRYDYGIQFYLDNHNDHYDTCYYMWKLSSCFKYQASFRIHYTYEGEYIPYPNPDSLRTCYFTSRLDDIFIFSTQYFDKPIVEQFPLNFASTNNRSLSMRYSLLVNQLSISKSTYDFFTAIEQQNIDQGNLYSKQPMQIKGNVENVNNPDEPVLGYFIVAGSTKKRIYVDRPKIPFYYEECTPDYDLRFIRFEPPSSWPIYIVDIMFTGWAMGPTNSCFDCRLDGGSLTPPDFWVENQ